MNYFITGDVHGCFYTFQKMLEKWDREKEIFIQVGDLVDRGLHSARVVELAISIAEKYPNSVFLKGNHEALMIKYFKNLTMNNWFTHYGEVTIGSYIEIGKNAQDDLAWLGNNKLVYETDFLFVSHAGLTQTENPYEEDHADSLIWNRKPLLKLKKVQVHGHTPHTRKGPHYNRETDSWNVDTGACFGKGLSSLRLSEEGKLLEKIFIKTDKRDFERENKE
jgi:serine/threonine protein phosphatase 1